MTRALIIYGAAPHQMREAKRFDDFLKHNIESTSLLPAAYLTTEELQSELKSFLHNNSHEPALIYYAGHGSKGIWGFNEDCRLEYSWLAELLKSYQDRFSILLINDCCAANSLGDSFVSANVDPLKVGLISATQSKNYSYAGMLLDALLPEWGRKRAHISQLLSSGVPTQQMEVLTVLEYIKHIRYKTPLASKWNIRVKYFKCLLVKLRDKIINRMIVKLQDWQGKDISWLLSEDQVSQRWGAELDYHFFQNGKPPLKLKCEGKFFLTA